MADATSRLVLTYLVNAAWQIPIIATVALVCSIFLRRVTPQHRHILWVSALLVSVLLPISTLPNRVSHKEMLPSITIEKAQGDMSSLLTPIHSPTAGFSLATGHRSWSFTLGPVLTWTLLVSYCGLIFYRLIKLCWLLHRTTEFRNHAHARQLAAPLSAIVNRCVADLSLKQVEVLCSSALLGPVTLGIRRPTVILPDRFFTDVSEADFSSAICHELAHVRRRDFLLNLACEILSVPISFHPAAFLIKHQIERTRELACDELAASKLSTRAGYARSLISIAQSMSRNSSVAATNYTLGLFDTHALEERIMNLLEKGTRMGQGWARLLMVLTLAMLTGACLCVSAFSVEPIQQASPAVSGASGGSSSAAGLPIVVKNVTFTSANGVGQEEQQGFAKKLESMSFRSNDWTDEVKETVKDFWQQHGYLLVGVWVEVHVLKKDADKQLVALDVNVNEGEQYRLKELQWKGATVFGTEELAALMPVKDGDVLDTAKVRSGLEALRRQYVSKGYTQFVCAVQTKFDMLTRTIVLIIDLEEGQKSSPQASLLNTQ
jgi:beta-lactamase regulating signal transducer with metallopeptidase domain